MNMVSIRSGCCPSETLPLFNNLRCDDTVMLCHHPVTESSMRSIGATLQVFGLLMDHLALRLQDAQVVESLRVGSVPVRGVEGS